MEVNVNVDPITAIMAQNRPVIQQYGKYYGQQLFTILKINPDPKFKEDKLNGLNGLRNEIFAYVIKAVDISTIDILPKDVDGRPKVVLNKGDKSLVFEMVAPEFTKATRENVIECIDRLSKPNSKPMFFSAEDLNVLSDLVRQANQTPLSQFEEFARKYMRLSETVRGYMDANIRIQKDYLRQCGITQANNAEVNITVETKE